MRDILLLFRNSGYKLNGEHFQLETDLYKFLEKKCLSYGSSIEGRRAAFFYLTGHKCLLPLVCSNYQQLYFLATRSYKAKDAYFINYQHLLSYKRVDDNSTILYFDTGFEIVINCNFRIIKRQTKLMNLYIKNYYSLYNQIV